MINNKGKYIERFSPPPRIRYSSTIVKDKNNQLLYLFGGSGGVKHSSFWNDVWILDLNSWKWHEACSVTGQIPLPRYGHTATLVGGDDTKARRRLIMFGGKASPPHYLQNDVYEFNLDTLSWKKLQISGEAPAPRYYHTATYIGNECIVIFGGRSDVGETNDVYILDLKAMTWTQPNLGGKFPTKRYQHSTFATSTLTKLIIYGGINRMTALQDVHILDLETNEWRRLKSKTDAEFHTTRVHEYGIYVNDKLLVIDFDMLTQDHKIDYIEFADDTYDWKSITVNGEVPETSQLYSINTVDNMHIFMQIPKNTLITVLQTDDHLFEQGALEMRAITREEVPSRLPPPTAELGQSDVVSIECHYAGTKWFTADISPSTTFTNLAKLINKTFNLQSSEIIACIESQYRNVTSDNFPQVLRERRGTLPLYIAESVRVSEIKKKRLDFLTHQATTISSSPHEYADAEETSFSVNQQEPTVKQRHKKEKSDVVLPLPKLFAKPTKLTLLRRIHKKVKQFESKGLDHSMRSRSNALDETTALLPQKKHTIHKDHFNWLAFTLTLMSILCLPLYSLFLCFQGSRYSIKGRIFALLFGIIEILCVALPIVAHKFADHSYKRELLGEASIYAPVIIYFMFSLIMATIEGVWKNPTKLTQELAKYNVTLLQSLVTNEYGERSATADDIVFAITNKEETTQDRPGYAFLTYVFSAIAAAGHSTITIAYLAQSGELHFSSNWVAHLIAVYGIGINFVMMFLLLFGLGCALTIYARQLTHIKYFGALPAKEHAKALELPTLPLTSMENAMAWMKIRSFIKGHHFLPLTSANVMLGYAIILGIILWITVVIQIFTSKIIFTTVTTVVMFDAVLMAIYIIITLWIGAHINAWQEKYVSMLYKEQLKLSLLIRQLKEEESTSKHASEEISQLKGCKEVLHILASVIEKQENAFSILGISISETATKAILGLTISLTVAVIARIGLDLTEENKE